MTEFYLPYQFIPATGKIKTKTKTGDKETSTATIDFHEIQQGSENHMNARHDVWLKDKLHGRITCSIFLETPLVIGASHEPIGKAPDYGQEDKRQKKVIPYKYKGQYAIPANSLRGMVSSIAEAISQSALRVLEDKPLSARDYPNPKVPLGTTYDYFSPDLLPLTERRRKDGTENGSGKPPLLTPAEILFGVVEEGRDEALSAIALKSRLRFHDALPKDGANITIGKEITLKILATPKPPAPAMYFVDSRNSEFFIKKTELDHTIHQPRGRKIYLHHQQSVEESAKSWETKGNRQDHQKMKCTPIEAKQSFYFHIDFENLTSAELTLVRTSLSPDPNFRHRLGLGKPLGLGSIRVNIEKTDFHCPIARYNLSALNSNSLNPDPIQPAHDDNNDTSLIDDDTLQILITIGRIGKHSALKPGIPVRYPFTNNPDNEEKLYEWYKENEKQGKNGHGQVLGLVKPGVKPEELSTLRTYPLPNNPKNQ